jgi:hypothetical protein
VDRPESGSIRLGGGNRLQPLSLIRFQNANIAQVAIFLGEVKSIPYDEFVWNAEANVRDVDLP